MRSIFTIFRSNLELMQSLRTVAITPTKSKQFPWEEVKRVCQESTIAGMKAMHEAGLNKPFRFLYISGMTAERDQTKKPSWMAEYALMRVSPFPYSCFCNDIDVYMQGETETQVLAFAKEHDFEAAAAKPGLISSKETIAGAALGAFLRVTGVFPSLKVEEIAAAMLHQVLNGFEKEPLENADLQRIGTAALQQQD